MKPCDNCPFRKRVKAVRPVRARQIAEGLRIGRMFSCHKTTTVGGARRGREQWCLGAAGTLVNEDTACLNQMVRIAERFGMLDLAAIEDRDDLYGSVDEWAESHR